MQTQLHSLQAQSEEFLDLVQNKFQLGSSSLTVSQTQEVQTFLVSLNELKSKFNLLMQASVDQLPPENIQEMLRVFESLDSALEKYSQVRKTLIESGQVKEEEIGSEVLLEGTTRLLPIDKFRASRNSTKLTNSILFAASPNSIFFQSNLDQDEDGEHRFECPICFENTKRKEMFKIRPCGHLYCDGCLENYLSGKINDGEVLKMVCPCPGCESELKEEDLSCLISANILEKYRQFVVLARLRVNPNVRWCPNPSCAFGTVCEELESQKVSCEKCKIEFCFLCSDYFHEGLTCEQNSEMKGGREDEALELWAKQHRTKKCSQCGISIQKIEGCNYMKCGSCKSEFCWICLSPYTGLHFEQGLCAGLQYVDDPVEIAARQEANRNAADGQDLENTETEQIEIERQIQEQRERERNVQAAREREIKKKSSLKYKLKKGAVKGSKGFMYGAGGICAVAVGLPLMAAAAVPCLIGFGGYYLVHDQLLPLSRGYRQRK